jgi:hypothetical protein
MSPIDSRAPQLARSTRRAFEAHAPAPLRWIPTDYMVAARREDGAD